MSSALPTGRAGGGACVVAVRNGHPEAGADGIDGICPSTKHHRTFLVVADPVRNNARGGPPGGAMPRPGSGHSWRVGWSRVVMIGTDPPRISSSSAGIGEDALPESPLSPVHYLPKPGSPAAAGSQAAGQPVGRAEGLRDLPWQSLRHGRRVRHAAWRRSIQAALRHSGSPLPQANPSVRHGRGGMEGPARGGAMGKSAEVIRVVRQPSQGRSWRPPRLGQTSDQPSQAGAWRNQACLSRARQLSARGAGRDPSRVGLMPGPELLAVRRTSSIGSRASRGHRRHPESALVRADHGSQFGTRRPVAQSAGRRTSPEHIRQPRRRESGASKMQRPSDLRPAAESRQSGDLRTSSASQSVVVSRVRQATASNAKLSPGVPARDEARDDASGNASGSLGVSGQRKHGSGVLKSRSIDQIKHFEPDPQFWRRAYRTHGSVIRYRICQRRALISASQLRALLAWQRLRTHSGWMIESWKPRRSFASVK